MKTLLRPSKLVSWDNKVKVNMHEMLATLCILIFFILSTIIQLLYHAAVSLSLTVYTQDTLDVTFDLLEKGGGSEPSPEDPLL